MRGGGGVPRALGGTAGRRRRGGGAPARAGRRRTGGRASAGAWRERGGERLINPGRKGGGGLLSLGQARAPSPSTGPGRQPAETRGVWTPKRRQRAAMQRVRHGERSAPPSSQRAAVQRAGGGEKVDGGMEKERKPERGRPSSRRQALEE